MCVCTIQNVGIDLLPQATWYGERRNRQQPCPPNLTDDGHCRQDHIHSHMSVDQPVNDIVDRSANEYIVSTVVQDDEHTVCPSSPSPSNSRFFENKELKMGDE
jgi:hypothetical protein